MKLKHSIIALIFFTFSCSLPNQSTVEKSNKSFSIKSVNDGENTSLSYKGVWNEISDTNATSGSYHISTPSLYSIENDNTSLKYSGNWSVITNSNANGGNLSYTDAGENGILLADYTDTSKIKYSGSWGQVSDNSFLYNDTSLRQTIQDDFNQGAHFFGNGWQTIFLYQDNNGYDNYDHYINSCSDPINVCPSHYEITFTGDNIRLLSRRGPVFGKVKVTVIDTNGNIEKVVDNIDMYHPNWMHSQTLVWLYDLEDKQHTIKVEPIGKNPLSSDYIYDFDVAYIYKGAKVIEDSSGTINYNGAGWYNFVDETGYSSHYNESCSNPLGTCPSNIEFTFTGTNIKLFGRKSMNWGQVKVSLFPQISEGLYSNTPVDVKTNDMYSNLYSLDQVITEFKGLETNKYKVRIESLGKNPSSTNYIYDFDKAIVYPSAELTFNHPVIRYKTLISPYAGMVDVLIDGLQKERLDLYNSFTTDFTRSYTNLGYTNHRLTVEGTGLKNQNSIDNLYYVKKFDTLPTVTGSFRGTRVDLTVGINPNYGKMDLYIDNNFSSNFDTYSPTFSYVTASISGLNFGDHTFTLIPKDEKNPSAIGYSQIFDTAITDSFFTYTFEGKGFDYIAQKNTDMGIADIYVDSVFKGSYDLYSSSKQDQEIICSINGLSNTTHTLEIVRTGRKNDLSTGVEINVDRIKTLTTNPSGTIILD